MSLAEETEAGESPASALLELIGEKVPAERADAIRAFAQAYLRRLAGDASEGISPDHLLAEVLGVFEFASRRDEPVAVRAFNPTLAEHGYEPQYGARPLRRLVQRWVDDRIADLFVSGDVTDGGAVRVDAVADDLVVTSNATLPLAA